MSQGVLLNKLFNPIHNLKVSAANTEKSVLVVHVNVQKEKNSETTIAD